MALINGKMVKDLREQRGLSQQELADRSKVGLATVKRIESAHGDQERRTITVTRLADALEVTLDDLAHDQFTRIVDIGDDVHLYVSRQVDPDDIRRGAEELAQLLETRNRILKRYNL